MTAEELAVIEAEQERRRYLLDNLHLVPTTLVLGMLKRYMGLSPSDVPEQTTAEDLVREHLEACEAETLRPGELDHRAVRDITRKCDPSSLYGQHRCSI